MNPREAEIGFEALDACVADIDAVDEGDDGDDAEPGNKFHVCM